MAKLNLNSALGLAGTGAAIGSSFAPGIGTAIGGGLGFLGGLFTGKKKKPKKRSTLDKNQQQINKDQKSAIYGQGPLADLYNYNPDAANSVFEQTIANPAYRQFNENVAPQITGAFRSQGTQNSSYAGDALARAGRDVQLGLDAQRSQYLYNQENNARTSKQNAIENFQNRQNFAYDTAAPSNSGGASIDNILRSITPDAIEGMKDFIIKYAPGGV